MLFVSKSVPHFSTKTAFFFFSPFFKILVPVFSLQSFPPCLPAWPPNRESLLAPFPLGFQIDVPARKTFSKDEPFFHFHINFHSQTLFHPHATPLALPQFGSSLPQTPDILSLPCSHYGSAFLFCLLSYAFTQMDSFQNSFFFKRRPGPHPHALPPLPSLCVCACVCVCVRVCVVLLVVLFVVLLVVLLVVLFVVLIVVLLVVLFVVLCSWCCSWCCSWFC